MTRLVASLLALMLAFASVAACPARAASCGKANQKGACCDKTTLASGKCCCSHAGNATELTNASVTDGARGKHAPVLASVPLTAPSLVASLARYTQERRRGLAPPDTPVRLRTLLTV